MSSYWKIVAGLKLRQDMIVNKILFNYESWHGVSTQDLLILEVDEKLLIIQVISARKCRFTRAGQKVDIY